MDWSPKFILKEVTLKKQTNIFKVQLYLITQILK